MRPALVCVYVCNEVEATDMGATPHAPLLAQSLPVLFTACH